MNSKTKKILFLVEGEHTEKNITTNLAKNILKLAQDSYEIVSYGTCIYELYDELFKDEYLSLVDLLIEKGEFTLKNGESSKTLFSQIYLFFDFEPHYQKYSKDKITKMLNFFNDIYSNGKLYINYPMVESIFCLNNFNNPSNFPTLINLDNFSGKKFKKWIKEITCFKSVNNNINLNLNNEYHVFQSIKWNYIAYCKICNKDYKSYLDELDYNLLLSKQINLKNKQNSIYSIATMVLLFIDYYPEYLLSLEQKISHP